MIQVLFCFSQFDKMETLDEYLQKKKERFNQIMTPGKSAVKAEEKSSRKSPRTTVGDASAKPASTFKPIVQSVKDASFNFGSFNFGSAKPFVFNAKAVNTLLPAPQGQVEALGSQSEGGREKGHGGQDLESLRRSRAGRGQDQGCSTQQAGRAASQAKKPRKGVNLIKRLALVAREY